MTFSIETVFAVGIVVFSLSALYFLFTHKKDFNSAFLVSFITIISYTLMLEGSLATIGAEGGAVYATRWVFYGLSCTLLMYEIAKFLNKNLKETLFLLYLTVIVMGTGAAAALYDGWFMIGLFVISSVAYVLLVLPLLYNDSEHKGAVAKYIVLGWTGFPIAFLLAPDGFGVITAVTAAVLYLALDIFTKVIFYADLHKKMEAQKD